jgi:VIT1/CCC1 family predicted Fe2+/Mn2+ transporter/rubrerythrin
MRIDVSKTELNLWTSFMDEAKTQRLYSAYALQALREGYPEVAEAFMQAAGDEIIHALMHLRALGAVKSTAENLRQVVEHEAAEAAVTYPRYIAEAKAEGRTDALEGFEVAMAREQAHVKLFRDALALVERRGPVSSAGMERSNLFDRTATRANGADTAPAAALDRKARGVEKMSGPAGIGDERERVASRTRIREFVFGAQDGLLTTVSVVSAFFGAHENNTTILLAGVATGVAGMVAMTAGQYLSSKAESEVHRSEIDRELREILEHPAEELAELAEIYHLQGMSIEQARDAALAVSKDPNKALEVMARAELGLDTESAGNPLKDAAVMAPSFLLGAIAPVLPYVFTNGNEALALSIALACLALFAIGIIKARVTNGNPWRSGLEQFLIGAGAGVIGYVVGTFVPGLFGVKFVGG